MFSLREIALAHAVVAEKLLHDNGDFLKNNEAAVPVFVNLLFQALEITLKSFAIESGIAEEGELRSKRTKKGHGVKEIAELINERLNGESVVDVLLPMRGCANSNGILKAMIFDSRFAPSRESYSKRDITYSQFKKGELQLIDDVKAWVKAVKLAAEKVELAIQMSGSVHGQ